MKKRLCILLAVMIFSLCAAFAETVNSTDADGIVTEMPDLPTAAEAFDFNVETGTITGYHGDDVHVVVPREIDGTAVVGLDSNAFDSARDYRGTDMAGNRTERVRLCSVVLPETIRYISDNAFGQCRQLNLFVCYGPLETSGKGVFNGCESLEHVIYVNGVKRLDSHLFDHCESLKNVYTGGQLDSIAEDAFFNCGIENFVLSAKQVEGRAFRNCPKLREVHIAEGAEQYSTGAFYECPSLKTVCIEGTDAAFLPSDGLLHNASSKITVIASPQLPQDQLGRLDYIAGRSDPTPTITVLQQACSREDAELVIPKKTDEEQTEELPETMPTEVGTKEQTEVAKIGEDGAPYLGSWITDRLVMEGTTYSAADFGMQTLLKLNADGTFEIGAADDFETGTWYVENGTAQLVEMESALTAAENGELCMSGDGAEIYYVRGSGEDVSPEAMTAENRAEYVGVWHAISVIQNGERYELENPEQELLIRADGTASISYYDEAENGLWEATEEGILIDGELPSMLNEQGELCLYYDDGQMVFVRVGEIESTESELPADPVDAAPYMGDWYLSMMVMGGEQANPTDYGIELELNLTDDGQAVMSSGGAEPDLITWSAAPDGLKLEMGDGYVVTAVLGADGSLTLTESEDVMIFIRTQPKKEADYSDRMGVKFDMVSANVSGYSMTPEQMGDLEYSLTFHADGTCDFVLAGMSFPALSWEFQSEGETDIFAFDYFGDVMRAVVTEDGFEMQYYDRMTIQFEK